MIEYMVSLLIEICFLGLDKGREVVLPAALLFQRQEEALNIRFCCGVHGVINSYDSLESGGAGRAAHCRHAPAQSWSSPLRPLP
jgi:hypothetical protein